MCLDGLVGLFGVEPISAVGMAPGGTMMENFLQVHGLMPATRSTTDVYVAVLGDAVREANKLTRDLRAEGINVEVDLSGHKLDRQIKTALKKAIPYILFIGEEEVKSGIYTIKDIAKSQEYKLNFADLTSLIKE